MPGANFLCQRKQISIFSPLPNIQTISVKETQEYEEKLIP